MATKSKKIYKKKNDRSLELVGYLPTEDVSSRVDNVESSINNLNNAVADRYTKGETDGKLDNEAVKTNNTKDITYNEIAAMKRSYVGSSKQGPYSTENGSHENLIRIVNNYFGGDNYVFEMSHYFLGNDGIHYRYKAEGEYSQWKTLIDSDSIGSQHVSEADHASVADTFTYGRGVYLSANSVNENTSWVKAVFGDETDRHFHITELRTLDTGPKYIPGNYSAGIAWKGDDTYGALTVSYDWANAYICGGNGTAPVWGRSIVLSENGSNIADQSVAYADRAGYANSSGTAAVCESTALLAAEGNNLGAKIRSQYTTGTPGGSVTYHQATWYVTGNDGDTYNFSKMITTDNFGTNLTEALKNTKVEHTTRSDYATYLDYRNDNSTSIPISYDRGNGTSLKYTSYPKLTINGITGYGVLEGNVYNHGTFQLAVSDNLNGVIYVRSVAKDGSAPSWAKLLIDDDVINSLDSDIIDRPLSAYQGKVMSGKITSINSNITSINSSIASINSKFLDYQPKLNSETGATMQWLSFKNGSSYSISGIWCGKVEMTIDGSVGTQANANFTVDTTYQSTFNSGSWYFVAMPCEGGYINTLSWGLETNSSNTGGTLYALRVYSGVRTKYKFNIIGIRFW